MGTSLSPTPSGRDYKLIINLQNRNTTYEVSMLEQRMSPSQLCWILMILIILQLFCDGKYQLLQLIAKPIYIYNQTHITIPTALGRGTSFQPFQCQSSSDQSGLVYTPNIPDVYFNDINAAVVPVLEPVSPGTTYIYTIPSEQILQHNCSGGVVSIQYCYQTSNLGVDNTTIFNLLSLRETGSVFTVDSSIPIRSDPSKEICTSGNPKWCCYNTPLSSNQLSIPSSEYTFGVVTFSGDTTTPLAFHNSVKNYLADRIEVAAVFHQFRVQSPLVHHCSALYYY